MGAGSGARGAEQAVRRVAGSAAPLMERLARIGYASKGIIFLLIGALAAEAAFHAGGRITNTTGALRFLWDQNSGGMLVAVIGAGLAAYSLWSLVRAIIDPENRSDPAKSASRRVGYAASAIGYGFLAYVAFRLVLSGGQASTTSGGTEQHTRAVLAHPYGPWLVGLVGVIFIAVGFGQLARAATANFRKRLDTGAMPPSIAQWAPYLGKWGVGARGVTFLVIGAMVIDAAVTRRPSEASGLNGALETMLRLQYGPILLAIVALGLVAYGLYQFVEARYRIITV